MTSLPIGGSSEEVVAEMIEPLITMFVEQLDRCDDSDAVSTASTQILANQQVDQFVLMFNATGNAVFIWQAYQLFREWGLPVREDVLKMFDRMAARLMEAKDSEQILTALRLRRGGGGQQAVMAAYATEGRYQAVYQVLAMRNAGYSNSEAIRETARLTRRSPGSLRALVSKLAMKVERSERRTKRRRTKRPLQTVPSGRFSGAFQGWSGAKS